MTNHYTKVLLTIIALCLIWNNVTDTPLEPVVSAQSATWEEQYQNWENTQAVGLQNSNSVLPDLSGLSSGDAYICIVKLLTGTSVSSGGDSGMLSIWFTTKKKCKGTQLGLAYIHSEGATSITSHPSHLYSEAQLMSTYENAARAAESGQRVTYHLCGTTLQMMHCIMNLSFWATK